MTSTWSWSIDQPTARTRPLMASLRVTCGRHEVTLEVRLCGLGDATRRSDLPRGHVKPRQRATGSRPRPGVKAERALGSPGTCQFQEVPDARVKKSIRQRTLPCPAR